MSLSQKIAAALDARPTPAPCRATSRSRTGRTAWPSHLTASGPVGLAFDALDFTDRGASPTGRPKALKAWGDRLAARVTYLMEPLVVLEQRRGRPARSSSGASRPRPGATAGPTTRSGSTGTGTLRLSRVAFDEATRRRRPTACQMTREVLERLADDLVASGPAG